MFTRLWALLLIMICGFNAVGVSGSAFLSEKAEEIAFAVSLAQPDSQESATLTTHDAHSSTDEHGDCGTEHQNCHTCHLGHCNFLVTSPSGLVTPDLVRAIRSTSNFSYLISIDLSGPRKPPRA